MAASASLEPLVIPAHVWQRPEVRMVLRERDVGTLFRLLRRHGASQGRLATALGLSQGRVSEITRWQRTLSALEVFERLADGLGMPDDARMLLGLAPHQCSLYTALPTWRVIATEDTLFVSIFSDTTEGHLSPMYRITATATGGALYRGFRRHLDEVRRTGRRIV